MRSPTTNRLGAKVPAIELETWGAQGGRQRYLVRVDRRIDPALWHVYVWMFQPGSWIPSHWRRVYGRDDIKKKALRKLQQKER